MTLRKRLSLIAAASVGVAVLIAVAVCYAVVRSQLRGQVDRRAQRADERVDAAVREPPERGSRQRAASSGGPAPYNQVVLDRGQVVTGRAGFSCRSSGSTLALAGDQQPILRLDIWVNGSHLRMLRFGVGCARRRNGVPAVVQLARPLNGVDSILRHLRLFLALSSLGGVALAARLAGSPRAACWRRWARSPHAAQHIGETDDLTSA